MTRNHVLLDDHGYPLIWVRRPSRLRLALTVLAELAVLIGLFVVPYMLLWLLAGGMPR